MDLKGKKLLLMGGGAYAKDIKKYKDEKGFEIVGLGKYADTPIAQIADSFYQIDTRDIEAASKVAIEEKADGIFVGASEFNIISAIKVSEKTGCNFYVNQKQWDILANKAKFKELCRQNGVPVVPEFDIKPGYTKEDVKKLQFPVLLKPTDSSGAKGMNACYRAEDFDALYEEALKWSDKKEVIVEELITDASEVFFQYTIQDGECSLTSCFTKILTECDDKNILLPIFHVYPTKFIDVYFRDVHESIKRLFKSFEVKNGVMTIQSFYRNGKFYVFEAGFRMGGAQNYLFSEYQNGTNCLEYMINYALTGSMSEYSIAERDNAKFRYPCCNYYVGLKPGIIGKMGGVDEVRKLDGVLNVNVMCKEGTEILNTNALERVCLRIHVVGKSAENLAQNLVNISNTLNIVSIDGEDMQLEPLRYERCLEAIKRGSIF